MAKIFVSYSRKDSPAARNIIQALKDMGQDVWVDWEDIPPASDWLQQIFRGIEASDAFIFLVSPDSAASEVCKVEVGHAVENEKRIIPVQIRLVNPADTIDSIRKLNWTFMHEPEKFDDGLKRIKEAIELDFEWVEEHGHLQLRALDWDRKKEASLLLRGRDLWTVRQRITKAEVKDPRPTNLQKTYVDHSSRNERRNIILLTLAAIAVVAMAFLSYAAIQQRNIANFNAAEANQQRQVAKKSEAEAIQNAREANAARKRAEAEKVKADKARQEAEDSKNIAAAQRSAARAQIYQFRPGELYTSTLLAIDSWLTHPSAEAEEILRENISLLPNPVKQMTHAGRINAVEFNSAGNIFLTAGADGSACAWQVSDGKNLFCSDSPGAVNDAVFSPVDNIFITGDDKGYVQIVNSDTGVAENQIVLGSAIRDVDVQKDGKFAAITTDNGKISLIDLNTHQKSFELDGANIKFAVFSPNGLQIATGSGDGVVSLWYLNQANKVINTRKHKGEILTLEFSPNGQYLVTGGADGAAVVIDTKTGDEKFRCLHDDQVKDIAFSPDGNWFVTVSNDRKIRTWDINTGRQILVMSQNNFVQAVKVSANGQWIATTGDDKTVRVWNAATGTELFQIPIKNKGTALGFSKDGKYLVAGDQGGFVEDWNISAIPTPTNYLQFDGVTASALYSSAGNLIAASDDNRTWLMNSKALSNLITTPPGNSFPGLKSNIGKIIFSAKDKWLGVLTVGNDIVIYNTQTSSGKTIRPENPVRAYIFSPDEKQMLTGDSKGNVQAWDTTSGRLINTVVTYNHRITAMAATSNLLAIGFEKEIHLLDINTMKELAQPASQNDIELLVFSPDGSMLASGNATGQIQIWTQNNGQFSDPKTFTKEAGGAMAFNPADTLLAVGSVNKTYLINLSTLDEFARIPQTGTVNSVAFSPDGNTLLTSSLKVVQFWDVTKIQEVKKEKLVEAACRHLIENLSADQWKVLFENEEYKALCPNLLAP